MTVAGTVYDQWRQYIALEKQVRDLEKQQRQEAGSTSNWDQSEFVVYPSCPPSTYITFRGGLTWWPSNAFRAYGFYMPSYTVDLTDKAKASVRLNYSNYSCTFTNAYWYVAFVILLTSYGLDARETWPETVPDTAIYLVSSRTGSPYYTEYETAAEAESSLLENTSAIMQRCTDYGIPAGSVILRNNGNISSENEYMVIDPINRGRSYLWWIPRNAWEMA